MKYKMQDKQNQLIERISDHHLVVGVDIAQQVHIARAVNFRGIVIGDPLSFENNEEGFVRLLNWINQLKATKGFNTAIVGMEPTGHYWLNLSKWLYSHSIEVVTVNPHLVKKNKENRDNTQSKSDKKDALVIADMVKNGYYSFIRPSSEAFEKVTFTDKLLGIKGLTEITLGGILGEAGDLSKFTPGNSLLRHAGLHLAESSSGKWKGQIVISKRGRSRLRRFLYLATLSLVMLVSTIITLLNVGLFVGSQRKHGVLEYLNNRALTHSVSKTGLHPLDRHDEGMIGLRPVETWEGKPPGAAWRMRAVYRNNWSLNYTPLFKYAFM